MYRTAFFSALALVLTGSISAASEVRRVVTGLDASNKAVALFDGNIVLDPAKSGVPGANLWVTDSSPAELSFRDDSAAKVAGLSVLRNGTTLRIVEFPPVKSEVQAKLPPDFMMKVIGDHAPKKGLPPTHPMMHRTRTVDYAVILTGEIELMLDDTVVHLKAGDVIVQQATNHAWLNRGKEPCRIMFVLMDAKEP